MEECPFKLLVCGRDFQEIDDNLLAPILEALKPLADIRVESQVVLKLLSFPHVLYLVSV